MIVTVLGSGSAYGSPQAGNYFGQADRNEPKNYRTRSSILFDFGDCNFLVDAGPDFRTQLNVNNISKIDAVLFTHAHADHINGLPDIQRLASNQKHPIDLFCSRETFEGIKQCYFYMFKNDNHERGLDCLHWHIFENGDTIDFNGHHLKTAGLVHKNMFSTAVRYQNFLFATDFQEIPDKACSVFENLDCILMETNNGFNTDKRGNGHNDFYSAFKLKDEFQIKKFVLTHLAIDVDYCRDSKKLPDDFELAYDGMKFEI